MATNVTAKTPLLTPLEERMRNAAAKLQPDEEGRGKLTRKLGEIMLDMERMNNEMKGLRTEVRRDIRAREKYFREEEKLLKKDSKNTGILASRLVNLGNIVAGLALANGIRLLGEGDISGGLSDIGVGAGIGLVNNADTLLPLVTTGVVNWMMARKLIPRRGVPTGNVAGNAKNLKWLRNPKLIATAAAIIAIPTIMSMIGGGPANASPNENIVMNKGDVEQFDVQVDKFSRILDKGLKGRQETSSGYAKPKKPMFTWPWQKDNDEVEVKGEVTDDFENDPEAQALLSLILEKESNGNYNTFFGGDDSFNITGSTLKQIYDEQTRRMKSGEATFEVDGENVTSTAVGAYQFMNPLHDVEKMYKAQNREFDPSKIVFDEKLQNELAIWLIHKKRGVNPMDILSRRDFDKLGKEWHGIQGDDSYKRYLELVKSFNADKSGQIKVNNVDLTVPGNNTRQVVQGSESGSATVDHTVSTTFGGTDGISIDRLANLLAYNTPAMFTQ